jgi:hypothetical protein
MIRLLILLSAIGCFAGCAAFDDWRYSVNNECRARTAWRRSDDHKLGGHDFATGWKQGYFDVSMGRSGPPVVPPAKFLSTKYQGPQGAAAISAWYEGYGLGAIAADKDGAGSQHRLPAFGLAGRDSYCPPASWGPGNPGPTPAEAVPRVLKPSELPTPAAGAAPSPSSRAGAKIAIASKPAGPWTFNASSPVRQSAWHPPDSESVQAAAYSSPVGAESKSDVDTGQPALTRLPAP